MHRAILLMLMLTLFSLVAGGLRVSAQNDTAVIASFTTPQQTVNRQALIDRSARIPVSWETVKRPLIANLFFEQILPDGSAINVELPRIVPWVASNGDGWAAPILPSDDAQEVRLRVRLINLISGEVYSERFLNIPIRVDGDSGPDVGERPAIVSFNAASNSVNKGELEDGEARIPVGWQAIHRPVNSNLVFDQILPDGAVVNVELPRENPWVNSEGMGVAAPVYPGDDYDRVRLRVQLVDLLSGRIFDQREITVSIGDPKAEIRFFTTTTTEVDEDELEERTERVPVSWAVDNRPDDANLIFEQVLDDGSIINVELPRDAEWVASAGDGIAAPRLPLSEEIDEIVLRVRLADMDDDSTLHMRQLELPIRERQGNEDDDAANTIGEATPEPTPESTAEVSPDSTEEPERAPEVVSFTASPGKVNPGGTVTLNWAVANAENLRIEMFGVDVAGTVALTADVIYTDLPLSGSQTVSIPADTDHASTRFVLTMSTINADDVITGAALIVPIEAVSETGSDTLDDGRDTTEAGDDTVEPEDIVLETAE